MYLLSNSMKYAILLERLEKLMLDIPDVRVLFAPERKRLKMIPATRHMPSHTQRSFPVYTVCDGNIFSLSVYFAHF